METEVFKNRRDVWRALAVILGALAGLWMSECGHDNRPEFGSNLAIRDVSRARGTAGDDVSREAVTAQATEPEGFRRFVTCVTPVTGVKTPSEKDQDSVFFSDALLYPVTDVTDVTIESKFFSDFGLRCDSERDTIRSQPSHGGRARILGVSSNLESREPRPAVLGSRREVRVSRRAIQGVNE